MQFLQLQYLNSPWIAERMEIYFTVNKKEKDLFLKLGLFQIVTGNS